MQDIDEPSTLQQDIDLALKHKREVSDGEQEQGTRERRNVR
jgi:hypothetical protein